MRVGFARPAFLVATLLIVAFLLFFPRGLLRTQNPTTHYSSGDLIALTRNVLQLGVIEVQLSQIYEIQKENLRVSSVPIPFTSQATLVTVSGKASVGYDLSRASIRVKEENKLIQVKLPEPKILFVDLDPRFVHEADTFLNRITPEDRNQVLAKVKRQIRKTLFTKELKLQAVQRAKALLKEVSRLSGYRTVQE